MIYMNKKKVPIKSWISTIILFLTFSIIGLQWISARGTGINYLDILWITTGVLSFFWIIIWAKYTDKRQKSLLVPYLPIFCVPIIGAVSYKLKLITSVTFLSLLILFLCSYIISFLVYSSYNTLKK